eukprot:749165-Rhodomonas_salina.1
MVHAARRIGRPKTSLLKKSLDGSSSRSQTTSPQLGVETGIFESEPERRSTSDNFDEHWLPSAVTSAVASSEPEMARRAWIMSAGAASRPSHPRALGIVIRSGPRHRGRGWV